MAGYPSRLHQHKTFLMLLKPHCHKYLDLEWKQMIKIIEAVKIIDKILCKIIVRITLISSKIFLHFLFGFWLSHSHSYSAIARPNLSKLTEPFSNLQNSQLKIKTILRFFLKNICKGNNGFFVSWNKCFMQLTIAMSDIYIALATSISNFN